MNKLCLLSCLLMPVVANAQTVPNFARPPAPKVVFIGDWATYYWTGFRSNWINQGVSGNGYFGSGGTSSGVAARFQADVVALHPSIVHILVGADDVVEVHDATWQYETPGLLNSLTTMLAQAKAANIKVILGLEPQAFTDGGAVTNFINAVIVGFAAENNIPVINYANVLCGCVDSVNAGAAIGLDFADVAPGVDGENSPGTPLIMPTPYGSEIGGTGPYIPSPDGYALMTRMAQAAITAESATLTGGYLQNEQQNNNDNEGLDGPVANVNTVGDASVIQFAPYGTYSDGTVQPMLNSNFAGSSGTWASSNPEVMYVSQTGLAWGLTPGTAIITYTSPTGVRFSEWIMYVANTE